MATIFINLRGSLTAGGPTVAAARLANGFSLRGHKVIYDSPNRADVCLCIIESGKTLSRVDRKRTKVSVRLDGAYYKEYWHSNSPDRMWRDDMSALHSAIKRDVENVDHMIYQSSFSKRMIDSEIAERKSNYSIINNGVDTNIFKPSLSKLPNGIINLFHHGVIRNDYIIDSLIGVVNELQKRGYKVKMDIVGSMDSVCSKIYKNFITTNSSITYHGPIRNSKLPSFFANNAFDIGLYPRMGSSSDNCVIETLSSSIPVIIPSWGGNENFINNEKEGIIVDSGGHWNYGAGYIQKMADGVEKIMPNIDDFKIRARSCAVKNYTIDIMTDSYLKAMGL